MPTLPAAHNVALPSLLRGERVDRARVEEALAAVGLAGRGAASPSSMSGGEQQRVAIARVLAQRPRIVFADEPTGALDSVTGEEVLAVLRARCDAGAAGLLVTHEPRHAAWADRVVYLHDGLVVDGAAIRPDRVPA